MMWVDGSVDRQLSMWLSVSIMSGLVSALPVSGVAACVDHSDSVSVDHVCVGSVDRHS